MLASHVGSVLDAPAAVLDAPAKWAQGVRYTELSVPRTGGPPRPPYRYRHASTLAVPVPEGGRRVGCGERSEPEENFLDLEAGGVDFDALTASA